LEKQDACVGLSESRILVGVHHLLKNIHRFRILHNKHRDLEELAREFAFASYGAFGCFFRSRVLIDKEPLEPIAFPDKDYSEFLENVRASFPTIRLLFLVRDPISTIWSMTRAHWGYSVRGIDPVALPLDEHIETWCANAELALEYADKPHVHLCLFHRMVTDPASESARISRFLGIKHGQAFEPRPTKEVGFGREELEKIRDATSTQAEALERWASE
jgi:hypothetical protein